MEAFSKYSRISAQSSTPALSIADSTISFSDYYWSIVNTTVPLGSYSRDLTFMIPPSLTR